MIKVAYELFTLALLIMGGIYFYTHYIQNSSPSTSLSNTSTTISDGHDSQMFKIGSTQNVAQFSVRLNSWQCGLQRLGNDQTGGAITPTGSFCIANLTATNISNFPAEFDGQGTIIDDQNRSFVSNDSDLAYANENEPLSYNFYKATLNPTSTITGNVVFDIPRGTRFLELQVPQVNQRTWDLETVTFQLKQ